MINLVILEDSVDMGGVQHSTLNFLKASKRDSSLNITILLPKNGPLKKYCDELEIKSLLYSEEKKHPSSIKIFKDNVKIPNVKGLIINYFNTRKIASRITEQLQNNYIECDLILTKGMYSHVSGSIVARHLNKPVVWHVQDFITGNYFGLYRNFFSYLVSKYCDYLIADGKPIVEALSKRARQNSKVVYNGLDVLSFYHPGKKIAHKQELGYGPNDYLIGNVARIVPWKGQLNLVKAFNSIAADIPDAKLILVGSPLFGTENHLNEIDTLIKKNNLDEKVKITGYINDLTHLYSALDTFVYPALEKDTCPLALIGAMASGTKIISSKIDGVYEVICDSGNCEFYPKDCIDSLAQLLKNAYTSQRSKNENLSINHNYALKYFDNSIYYQSIKSILINILKN